MEPSWGTTSNGAHQNSFTVALHFKQVFLRQPRTQMKSSPFLEGCEAAARAVMGPIVKEERNQARDQRRLGDRKFKAEQGDAHAQWRLGECYATGAGVEKNDAEAAAWFLKAAMQGNVMGQSRLARCYQTGAGLPKDPTEAAKWYVKAAEQGDAEAQCRVAGAYHSGEGLPQNDKLAVHWWRKAAGQQHEEACFFMGLAYYEGAGIEQSGQAAVHQWLNLARHGTDWAPLAQYLLGLTFYEGECVEMDWARAFKWWRKAADRGHSISYGGWVYPRKWKFPPPEVFASGRFLPRSGFEA